MILHPLDGEWLADQVAEASNDGCLSVLSDAYLAALDTPPKEQLEQRLQHWYSATELYAHQLHEMERSAYLEMKRKEYQRQRVARDQRRVTLHRLVGRDVRGQRVVSELHHPLRDELALAAWSGKAAPRTASIRSICWKRVVRRAFVIFSTT